MMGHRAPPSSAQGRSEAIPHPKPNKVSPCENYAAPASTLLITFRSIDTWSLPHEHGIVHHTNNPCKMALCGGSDFFGAPASCPLSQCVQCLLWIIFDPSKTLPEGGYRLKGALKSRHPLGRRRRNSALRFL